MNSKEPGVTVIIPTHNRASMLGRAIRSVLDQTFRDLELFVVDDASTDNTEEVVASFADSRLHYFRHDLNQGGSAARNTGIAVARGRYVAFLDSDDEWLLSKLAAQLEVFRNSNLPQLGVVTCGEMAMRDDQPTASWIPSRRGWMFENHLLQKRIGNRTSNLMVKRSMLIEHGIRFDVKLPARQDWDFVAQLYKRCQLDFAPQPLVLVHDHGGERVWTHARAIRAGQYLHDKYHQDLLERPLAHSRFHLRTAQTGIASGDWITARTEIRNAIAAHPYDLTGYLWYLLSLTSWQGSSSRLHHLALRLLRRFTFGPAQRSRRFRRFQHGTPGDLDPVTLERAQQSGIVVAHAGTAAAAPYGESDR